MPPMADVNLRENWLSNSSDDNSYHGQHDGAWPHHVFELVEMQRRALPALAGVHEQTGDRVAECRAPWRVLLAWDDCPEFWQRHLRPVLGQLGVCMRMGGLTPFAWRLARALTGTSMRAAYSGFAEADGVCLLQESMKSAKGTCMTKCKTLSAQLRSSQTSLKLR